MRTRFSTSCVMTACVGLGGAACAALQPQSAPTTLPILEVASRAEKYKNQVIRTCAPMYQQRFQSTPEVWELVQPEGRHPETVLVIPCRSTVPLPTTEGKCVTGRIAALDGSLRKPEIEVFSSSPLSEPWYIHELGPAAAPRG